MTRAQAITSRALWRRRVTFRADRLAHARKAKDAAAIKHWSALLADARSLVKRRDAQIKKLAPPMRVAALEEAEKLIGILEKGGNNRGPEVEKIIRANGGVAGEPWCGDFVAYCYRRAGSKAVTRAWASVYFLGHISGLYHVTTPKPGDIVRFNFSHTGLYVRTVRPGLIETIEGNTGSSGAVSDSAGGGDGVKRKHRSTALVDDYRRVSR